MEHHKYSDRRSSHVGSAIAAVGDTSGAMERKKTMTNLAALSCSITMMCMLFSAWGSYITLHKCMQVVVTVVHITF